MLPERHTCWIRGDIADETAPHFVSTQNCPHRKEEEVDYLINLNPNDYFCTHPDMLAGKPLRSFCPGSQANATELQRPVGEGVAQVGGGA
ncbi:MAG: hypothetical protein UY27_C0020G0018 [Candidatus Gottesmanbacteria bacterium GW2011_GWA1_48_13]|uniref:Uncharacterized protein n=1 Tax=Candidatus Gottesmanbacteria bacterium GW2011_GWA1_48_13 TaxID=1618439 RepID=A0A0G1UMP4_9BACT|nr:MAG: hypothetical protein UY27_C0020G0018 [Candidatus Gottesmanbacteria bacterium GW2011_GWA1_48_13]